MLSSTYHPLRSMRAARRLLRTATSLQVASSFPIICQPNSRKASGRLVYASSVPKLMSSFEEKTEKWSEKLRLFLNENVSAKGYFVTQASKRPTTLIDLPDASIEGFGKLSFPITEDTVKRLIALSEQSPFGMGSETVTDISIRKSWEIDSSKIVVADTPGWQTFMNGVLSKIQEDLGVADAVHADLYKLLIYEEGGHFKPHQDGQKTVGMFGTLAVQLPSHFTGGSMTVSHGGKTETILFDENCSYDIKWAAWYADCTHEILPVESGNRVTLVYNLWTDQVSSTTTTVAAENPVFDHSGNVDSIRKMIQGAVDDLAVGKEDEEDTAQDAFRFAYHLDHRYTTAGFQPEKGELGMESSLDKFTEVTSLSCLKQRDRVVVDTLMESASKIDCSITLSVIVSTHMLWVDLAGNFDDDDVDEDDIVTTVIGEKVSKADLALLSKPRPGYNEERKSYADKTYQLAYCYGAMMIGNNGVPEEHTHCHTYVVLVASLKNHDLTED